MRPEDTPFICILSGHIPKKKKTSNSFQMQGMVSAKQREIRLGTHHKVIND